MPDILVEGKEVARRFSQGGSDIYALQPASFEIRAGDRIALLGRSGSGKSTLLHLIAGLDTPTGGLLRWPALGPHDALRPGFVGIVFQAPSLIPTLNVVENIEVPLRIAGNAFAFATATAIFNSTYNAQSRVDAELTNGADVTLTGTTSHPASELLAELRAIPGVAAAEPMMHRFAYVGADLQDMFGINPTTIGKLTTISNAYFANHDVRPAWLDRLGAWLCSIDDRGRHRPCPGRRMPVVDD